ncbi:methyltransferase domain-containing protein [Baaleninema sp.]|uniref:methyltransferase domain-containing protein n=1 Tax=Baaleninema sp. TaxID=3101197 RepID=UPI003CFE3FD2
MISRNLKSSTHNLADLASGTGIGANLMAERRLDVMAVEPNRTMAANFQIHLLIQLQQATAEDTNLPNASVDIVTGF